MNELQVLKLIKGLIQHSSVLRATYDNRGDDYADTIDRSSLIDILDWEIKDREDAQIS